MTTSHTRPSARKQAMASDTAPAPSTPRPKRTRNPRPGPPPLAALLVAHLNETEDLLAGIWAEPLERMARIERVAVLLQEVREMADPRLLPPLLAFRLSMLEAGVQETGDIAEPECKDLDAQRAELAAVERHLAEAHGCARLARQTRGEPVRARLDVERGRVALLKAREALAAIPKKHQALWLRRSRAVDFADDVEDKLLHEAGQIGAPPLAQRPILGQLLSGMEDLELLAAEAEAASAGNGLQLAAYVARSLGRARALHARAVAEGADLMAVLWAPSVDKTPLLALHPALMEASNG